MLPRTPPASLQAVSYSPQPWLPVPLDAAEIFKSES